MRPANRYRLAAVTGLVVAFLILTGGAVAQGTNTSAPPDVAAPGAERATALAADSVAIALAVGALLIVAGVLVLVFGGIVERRVARATSGSHRRVKFRSFEIPLAAIIGGVAVRAVRVARVVLAIALFVFAVPFTLAASPRTVGWYSTFVEFLLVTLRNMWASFVTSLPDLGFILVVAAVVTVVLRFVGAAFEQVRQGRVRVRGFYPSWAQPTFNILRFLVIVFAAIIIVPHLPGFGSTAFQGVSLFLGILVSLGASSAIANIIAGVVLTYTRAFEVGDRVRIAETTGDVTARRLVVTRVRTIKNVDITIPNALVLASHITNYSAMSHDKGLIIHTEVTIGYDVPWRDVHKLLIAAAVSVEPLLKDPEPFVLQKALGDFSVTYEVNAYTDQPNSIARLTSELHGAIQDEFNAAGIEILSPHFRVVREGAAPPPSAPAPPPPPDEPAKPIEPDGGETAPPPADPALEEVSAPDEDTLAAQAAGEASRQGGLRSSRSGTKKRSRKATRS